MIQPVICAVHAMKKRSGRMQGQGRADSAGKAAHGALRKQSGGEMLRQDVAMGCRNKTRDCDQGQQQTDAAKCRGLGAKRAAQQVIR